jgi:hypothetical protein
MGFRKLLQMAHTCQRAANNLPTDSGAVRRGLWIISGDTMRLWITSRGICKRVAPETYTGQSFCNTPKESTVVKKKTKNQLILHKKKIMLYPFMSPLEYLNLARVTLKQINCMTI